MDSGSIQETLWEQTQRQECLTVRQLMDRVNVAVTLETFTRFEPLPC